MFTTKEELPMTIVHRTGELFLGVNIAYRAGELFLGGEHCP